MDIMMHKTLQWIVKAFFFFVLFSHCVYLSSGLCENIGWGLLQTISYIMIHKHSVLQTGETHYHQSVALYNDYR